MTKKLMVGKVAVGGGAPVSIQSMCNTKTDDVAATVAQIHALEDAGCEIIRVAVPDEDAAKAVDKIKEQIAIPLIADIHFNYKLALMCAERGIDALRINPGNIGGEEKVKAVADICRQKNIPIRIGVNGGSLEKDLRAKYGGVTAEALVESAMGHVKLLNRYRFRRYLHFREMLRRAADHAGLHAAEPADGLPAASGRHRGRNALYGYGEVCHGHRWIAVHGHRRYHSGDPDGGPGGGDLRRQKDPAGGRTAEGRA